MLATRWLIGLTFLAAMTLLVLAAHQPAAASSMGDRRCSHTYPNRTCQSTHAYNYHYYEVNSGECGNCNDSSSYWSVAFTNAKNSWSAASGPQYFTTPGGHPYGYAYTSVWLYQYPNFVPSLQRWIDRISASVD